ncbi:DnaJ domain-containing protein [Kaarinaea lacus]
MRQLLILIAVIALLWIIRFLYRQSSPDLKKIGRYLAIGVIAVLFLFLLATGRLHWIFAAIAAAVPVFFRMLPLLRYVPLLRNVYRKYQRHQAGGAGAAQGQSSSVRSRFIHMTLNHDSGEVDGEILQGQFGGKKLHDLSLQQLFTLLHECQEDNESVALLVAYLDRQHPDWREHADSASSSESKNASQDSGSMSVDEAFEILGLEKDATKVEIKEAHRKLISKLHPDHGGSTYLSAKINLAKDILLKRQ